MEADWLSAISAAGSAVLVPAALAFAGLQWRETARQTSRAARAADAAVYQSIAQQFFELNLILIDNPELHAYIYKGSKPPRRGSKRIRVRALSAILLDFMDAALVQSASVPSEYTAIWKSLFGDLVRSSPTLQSLWQETRGWYGPELRQVLDGQL